MSCNTGRPEESNSTSASSTPSLRGKPVLPIKGQLSKFGINIVNFHLLWRSAKQALDWIHDTGDVYLATHIACGSGKDDTEALLKEHNEFKTSAKV